MAETLGDLDDQFILARGSHEFPPGWTVRRHGEWTLATHLDLPVVEVQASGGAPAGWLVGYPIANERLIRGEEVVRLEEPLNGARLEDQLYRFAGRYVFALPGKEIARFYLDPLGSLSVTYCAASQVIASTTTLTEWMKGSDKESFRARQKHGADKPQLAPNHFYPGGLTHNPNIRRLLPNHYLDLRKWQAVRHWPKEALSKVVDNEIPEQVETIVTSLRSTIGAVTRDYETYLPLTSGRDSRMLLACAKEYLDRIRFVTFDYREDIHSDIDTHAGRRLSRSLRLDHIMVPIEPASSEEESDYLFRIGYSGNPGKARDFYKGCAQSLDMKRAWLTGFAGAIGRGNYWVQGVSGADQRFSARELVSRMHLLTSRQSEAAMEGWLAGLPDLDAWTVLDLLFLEQRVGCWSAPHLYGAAPFRLNLLPFCDRRIIEASLCLPVDYRSRKQLTDDMIKSTWPELGSFPYHSFIGLRRIWDPGVRFAVRVVSKLKRMAIATIASISHGR